ncbi:MAG: hemolysin family protein [Treponema sp.]|jgi:CBS domain containing-hemolysin-like protein|nr:hemolysin family protein [Treponema sp.]
MDKPASYYISLFAALFALLGLNLFFSLCETSFSSLSRIKLKNMAAQNKQKRKASRARLVLKMLETYDKLLSSILIGNTVVNITASALAAVLFFSLFGAKGVSFATAALTLIVLLFCEISPKTLAKESPELTAMRVSPFMRLFIIIFSPLNYLTGAWKKVIVKIFPVKADRLMTEDELLTFVEEVRQDGGINKHEEEMIRQAIEFDDITTAEICTPRVDVAAVSQTSTMDEIDQMFAETGFSRLPVYHETIDNITGIILLKDFHHEVIKRGKSLAEIVKPVVYVTKTMKISKLLRTLQQKQSHMAVLVDEFGGTVGIATIEDIIEELVGEIWDEHDEVVEPFTLNADGTVTVLGSANLPDMLEFINSKTSKNSTGENSPDDEAPAEDGELPNTTVGNWVMENSGGLPRRGEEFVWRDLRFRVAWVQRHRVMEVIVSRVTTNNCARMGVSE